MPGEEEAVQQRPRAILLLLPAAAAAVFLLTGHPQRAAFVVAATVVLVGATLAGVPVERGIKRGVEWVGEAIAAVLYVVIVIPVWALSTPWRRRSRPAGFRDRPPAAPADRSLYVPEPQIRARRGPVALAWKVVGIAVIVLGINYAIGYGWERLDPPAAAPAAVPDRLGVQPDDYSDPRADVPAMAAYPWSQDYFREMASVPIHYWPYLNYKSGTFEGRYVNVDGWTRASYEAEGSADARPTVLFFGGSKMWGEGQRDEYTIPSMVARYAEEAGLPITAVNHGQRGWVNWQEMLLFEQLTASGEDADLAVFYDGTNDVNAQLGAVRGVPTTTNVQEVSDIFDQTISERQRVTEPATTTDGSPSTTDLLTDLVAKYNERSAIRRLFGSEPAGASPRRAGRAVRAGRAADLPPIQPPSQEEVPDVVEATLDVYARGRNLISAIAEEHGVQPVFFAERQITLDPPAGAPADAFGRYRQIVDALADAGPGVTDIAAVLDDHQDTYIDPGHTNEEGAAVIARAMFEELEPQLAAWYREHG